MQLLTLHQYYLEGDATNVDQFIIYIGNFAGKGLFQLSRTSYVLNIIYWQLNFFFF